MDEKNESLDKRTLISFIAPASLVKKIELAAKAQLVSKSDIVRQAVLKDLEQA